MPCVYLPGPAPAVTVANTYLILYVKRFTIQFFKYLIEKNNTLTGPILTALISGSFFSTKNQISMPFPRPRFLLE